MSNSKRLGLNTAGSQRLKPQKPDKIDQEEEDDENGEEEEENEDDEEDENSILISCPIGYRDPSQEELSDANSVIGKRVAIFWDGNGVYFFAEIISYDAETQRHRARYEASEDSDEAEEEEDLKASIWKVWAGDRTFIKVCDFKFLYNN